MNYKLDKDWVSMSDNDLGKAIGGFIKHHRLKKNRTQSQVSEDAGISRSTLSLLEKGKPVKLNSLIRVLRVLELLYIMDIFKVETEFSPIEYAKLQNKARKQRANSSNHANIMEDIGW
jgi:transcriptional regulator with XRE-family HTH domain